LCDRHHFEFELDKAINQQVIEKLEDSPKHQLSLDLPQKTKGVYALYWKDKPVYAGKASGKTTLKGRLSDHYRKISGRRNINMSEMTCRYLEI